MVAESDIFLQNFRPGTIAKMGFDYETLKKLNEKIIMINVSAYGQDGSYRDRVGFDPLGQALGGMMSLNGEPDGPPVRNFFPLIDRITALHGCIGALAALYEREFSGLGQTIDVSLGDTGFTVNEIPISAFLGDGIIQGKTCDYENKDIVIGMLQSLSMKDYDNSIFDNIVGIGSKTKKVLLSHFGSIENIKSAAIRDLEGTPGIGKKMAKKIYEEFNE